MQWYLKVLRQYADFNGRARRMEYWMFFLFNLIFSIAAMIIDYTMGFTLGALPYGVFYLLYALAMFIPALAVTVRRLHDTGRTGWWILIGLVPVIGGIWLLILMLFEGDDTENEYGPNPKFEDLAHE